LPSAVVWIALAVALAAGTAVRGIGLGDVVTRSPDERFYLRFAERIATDGPGAARTLFAEYERDSTLWSFPVPNRIGYVAMVAGVMKASGVRTEGAGVAVSCALSVLSLLLLAWMALRFFGPPVAAAAVAFLAFTFGELAIAPRAWVDATFAFLGLLMLHVTIELTRAPRRIGWHVAFHGVGVLLLLTKQTGVVAYGACALWVLWVMLREQRWGKGAALLVAGGALSVALTLAIWGALAGGVGVALSALAHSLRPSAMGQAYVDTYSSGPWHQFFRLLWGVGPLTLVLAMIGSGVTVARARGLPDAEQARAAGAALVMTVAHLAFSCLVPGMQNPRYIVPADGAYCLLAAIGLRHSLGLASRRLPATAIRLVVVAALALVIAVLARDYRTFMTVVVRTGTQDIPARWVLDRLAD
jgi:hypothetical protein